MIYLGWRLIQCLKTNENGRRPCGDGRIKLAFLIGVILLWPKFLAQFLAKDLVIPDAELSTVNIERNECHGDWNYCIRSS